MSKRKAQDLLTTKSALKRSKRIKKHNNPLIVNAASSGDLNQVIRLVEDGVDVNRSVIEGKTALMEACLNEHINVVEYLIANGAWLNKTDNKTQTALWKMASNGQEKMLSLLIHAGADINKPDKTNNWTPLHAAVYEGEMECVEILLKNGADDTKVAEYPWRQTAFEMAHQYPYGVKDTWETMKNSSLYE